MLKFVHVLCSCELYMYNLSQLRHNTAQDQLYTNVYVRCMYRAPLSYNERLRTRQQTLPVATHTPIEREEEFTLNKQIFSPPAY